MLLGRLDFDLWFHWCLTVPAAVVLLVRYGRHDQDKNFEWEHILTGVASLVSLIAALLSSLNLAIEVFLSKPQCNQDEDGNIIVKTYLEKEKWNVVRNTFTNLSFVLTSFLYGYTNDTEMVLPSLILLALTRIMDVALDVADVAYPIPDKNRMSRVIFGTLTMLAAVILWIIYVTENPFDWEGENIGDEVALVVGFIFLAIHLLFLVLHIVLNASAVMQNTVGYIAVEVQGSEERKGFIALPNELPIVSKLVFTITLGSFSLVFGERLSELLNVTNIAWILLLLGVTEMAGRNIL
tara:strand:- start:143 stop:1027 length:885 start_codon:yes stop_codon:yes gene_type:complete